MRLRLIRMGYRLAWRLLWLGGPFRRGRGGGTKAVLSNAGRVLLVMHTYGPRQWELPGGGLHRNETPLDGIRREIREELAVELADPTLIAYGCASRHQTRRAISVFAAEVPAAAVTPDQREIERAEWHAPDALPRPLGWQVRASLDAWTQRAGAAGPVRLQAPRAA